MCGSQAVFSANGAATYQTGVKPRVVESPWIRGLKARPMRPVNGTGFQPSLSVRRVTQGDALGWYGGGAMPLKKGRQMKKEAVREMNGSQAVFSANGAATYQTGVKPRVAESPWIRGLKARLMRPGNGTGFQPSISVRRVTQGVALGWYRGGALPLKIGGGR
jgi:hypothetical protein